MPIQKLNPDIVNAAIEGFEVQKGRIDEQIAELRAMLKGTDTEPATTPEAPKRKRRLSAAGRRAIAEAARKRWAAVKAAVQPKKAAAAKTPTKKTAKRAPKKASKRTAAKRPAKKATPAPAAAQPTATE